MTKGKLSEIAQVGAKALWWGIYAHTSFNSIQPNGAQTLRPKGRKAELSKIVIGGLILITAHLDCTTYCWSLQRFLR